MLERSKKRVAACDCPTEMEWVQAQPVYWQRSCLVFALAANTRGGVVGKSMEQIVKEANAAGVKVSLRSFKTDVAYLQHYHVVYQDESIPYQYRDGEFVQRPSTWVIRLNEVMPDIRLADELPADSRPWPDGVKWVEGKPELVPF